jgi:hypothetical protein
MLPGADKAKVCQKCITNLDGIHAGLLLIIAKVEKVDSSDKEQVIELANQVKKHNQEASDHLDAAKLAKNKLKSFIQSM